MSKKKAARSKAGKGKSRGVVFDLGNLEVEMAFEDAAEAESPPSTAGVRPEKGHNAPDASTNPSIMNNPG